MIENQNSKELVLITDLGMLPIKEGSPHKKRYGVYRCHCGDEFNAQVSLVTLGEIKNCPSCRRQSKPKNVRENQFKMHRTSFKAGDSKYDGMYKQMISKCYNDKNKDYKYFGGRGAVVCKEWIEDKDAFISWAVLNGLFNKRLSLISPSDKEFSPDNCRAATLSEYKKLLDQIYWRIESKHECIFYDYDKFRYVLEIDGMIIESFNSEFEAIEMRDLTLGK